MSDDLYAAWLTAGDRLQPVGEWLADWWPLLTAAVLLALIGWACWPKRGDDYRTRNDRTAARHATSGPRPEPGQPGSDEALLAACNQLCPDLARKEMP